MAGLTRGGTDDDRGDLRPGDTAQLGQDPANVVSTVRSAMNSRVPYARQALGPRG